MAKTYILNMGGSKVNARLGDLIGGSGFWRWEDNVPKTFTVSSPIRKGAPLSRSGITTAPDILDVVDVVDGNAKRVLCGKVLVSTLTENFPNDSYVGRTFQVTVGPKAEGKRYKTCEVREVIVEGTPDEAADEAPAKKRK